jgi:alpha-D-xyloside xylohydrolase
LGKTSRGILLHPKLITENGTKSIRLEIAGDGIIHVVASPNVDFSREKSLCVIEPDTGLPDYNIVELDDTLVLSTSKIKARISKNTGVVAFFDMNDKVILREQTVDGRNFMPIMIDSTKGFILSQVFDSPEDEAFYGLGQHQSDEFNYKGKNEVLYQYNTKVAVPFLISNKNYGILWDNWIKNQIYP